MPTTISKILQEFDEKWKAGGFEKNYEEDREEHKSFLRSVIAQALESTRVEKEETEPYVSSIRNRVVAEQDALINEVKK